MKHSNKPYRIGIDSGSTMCKVALVRENEPGDYIVLDTGSGMNNWHPLKTAQSLYDTLLKRNGIDADKCRVLSTGYGREQISWADKKITEITSHGKGALVLNADIAGVIDIGGQDSKVIKLDRGKVSDFQMNDKCAAGTGRFLDMACSKLGIQLAAIDSSITTKEYAPINSMCAVFAESEIIGLLSAGIDREVILNGVIHSICSRIANMAGKFTILDGETFLFTGGLAQSNLVLEILRSYVSFDIVSDRLSPFAGAVGAAII